MRVPEGWSATSEGDNGTLGVQLRSGSSWVNVMPANAAKSASEVVLNKELEVAAQINSHSKGPFGKTGLLQLFTNGLEITYDHFGFSSQDSDPAECYIGGIGDISGKGHNYLLAVASASTKETKENRSMFLDVALSIHLDQHWSMGTGTSQ